jgi:hypothetical protein
MRTINPLRLKFNHSVEKSIERIPRREIGNPNPTSSGPYVVKTDRAMFLRNSSESKLGTSTVSMFLAGDFTVSPPIVDCVTYKQEIESRPVHRFEGNPRDISVLDLFRAVVNLDKVSHDAMMPAAASTLDT